MRTCWETSAAINALVSPTVFNRFARDERGHIASDPDRMDDEQYVVRLIGQVITVSFETVKVVKGLPFLAS